MGGAVMLLIAATVGITYGWTPDGGQGVKYIIQIPPNQVEQVVQSGEIASQIPSELRGHVSEVVIRVGNASLPRITPSNLARADYRSTQPIAASTERTQFAADDRSPLPIPAMGAAMELSPIRNSDSATAMMKPAPQGGGMNLPGSLGMPSTNPIGSSSNSNIRGFDMNLQQNARDTLNNAGNQVRNTASDIYQKTQQGLGQAADQLGRNVNSRVQSATNNARDAMTGMLGSDDPRNRLSQSNTATRNGTDTRNPNALNYDVPRPGEIPRTGENLRPGTDPYGQSNNANPYARSTTRPSTDPTNTRNFNDPRNSTDNQTTATNSQSDQDWYDLRNGSRRRPSTDPIDNNVAANDRDSSRSPSMFDNSNFGSLPSGLQPNSRTQANDNTRMTNSRTTSSRDTSSRDGYGANNYANNSNDPRNTSSDQRFGNSSNSNLDYDPRLTAAQAQQLPPNGYSFDEQGYATDRQGNRLNRFGQRTEETARPSTNDDNRGRYATGNDYQSGSNPQDINRNNYNPDQRYTNVATTNPTQNPTNTYGFNPNQAPYGNNTQLVQPPLAPTQGQFPSTNNSVAGNYPANPYPNPNQANPYLNPGAIGMGAYPQFTDPRLAGFGNASPLGANPNVASNGDNRSLSTTTIDGRSDSDALDSTSTRYAGSLQNPDQVAAQPIFNGMLLLSVVTNAYLLFWLKNLRLQFRDTVAAKRSSNGTSNLAATV